MKIVLMVVGVVLCVFGLVDLIGSFTGFDLWGGFLGVQLPEVVWKYSAYIEIIAGYAIFKVGMASGTSEPDSEAQSA